ncbi:transposase [Streptomyces asiaticus]|uniref:transposase n=1 Tax=Streptomyces asiaticus TaxID=114695 RepID=UPI003F67C286
MDDELWVLIEPLLPSWPRTALGPKPVDDRLCLQGILCVFYNDISWQALPLELGVRLRTELLAPTGPMGRGRCPGVDPGMRACLPAQKGRRGHRPVTGRPPEDGQYTPTDLRREEHSAQGHHHPAANVNDVTQTLACRRHPARRRKAGHPRIPTCFWATRATTATPTGAS